MGMRSHQLEKQFDHQHRGPVVGEHTGEVPLVADPAPGFVIQSIEPFGVCTHSGEQEYAPMHTQIGRGRVPVFLPEASTFSRRASTTPAPVGCVLCAHVPGWICVWTRRPSSSQPGPGGLPFFGTEFLVVGAVHGHISPAQSGFIANGDIQ